MFRGVYTAIVTPFAGGVLDEESLRNLITAQLEGGVDGVVPCGTTGEAPTLNDDEYQRVISITVEMAKGKAKVVAGAGSNCTAKAVKLTELAGKLGADGVLQVTPYYNKPTQEGIYRHFAEVAGVGLPVMVYNIPGRCVVNIETTTMARLAELENIASIKEASGDLNQMTQVSRLCGDKVSLLSGDDALTLPLLSVGGKGVVSVLSNLLPEETVRVCAAWERGEREEAWRLHSDLQPITKAMFMEPNPAPVKAALAIKGVIKSPETRLPIQPLSKAGRQSLEKLMQEKGML